MVKQIQAQINDPKGQYQRHKLINIIEPEIVTRPPRGIAVKARYSVVVYDRNGNWVETVERTAYPRAPFGAWMVWAIKYKGKWYSSTVNEIYPYLEIQEGHANPGRRNR